VYNTDLILLIFNFFRILFLIEFLSQSERKAGVKESTLKLNLGMLINAQGRYCD